MRPLAFLRNSILPPLADSIEEEDQENEFENPNKKSSKAAIMINEDDDINGLDAAHGNLDPKFMSFGEHSQNYEQRQEDSYNEDHLSSFQPSPLEFASQINYNDTDLTLSRNKENMVTEVSTSEHQSSLMRRQNQK